MKEIILYVKLVLLGAISGITLNILINVSGLMALFPSYEEKTAPALFSYSVGTALILYVIITPLIEEMLFRFLLFGLLRKHLPFAVSCLLSAAAFGLYHMNVIQFIYAFLMGMILAYVYEHDRRLRVPFIVHASANAAVYIISVTGILHF